MTTNKSLEAAEKRRKARQRVRDLEKRADYKPPAKNQAIKLPNRAKATAGVKPPPTKPRANTNSKAAAAPTGGNQPARLVNRAAGMIPDPWNLNPSSKSAKPSGNVKAPSTPKKPGAAPNAPSTPKKPGTAPKGSPAGGLRGNLASAALLPIANALLGPLADQAGTKLGKAIKASFDGKKAKDRKESAKSNNRRAGGTGKPPAKPKPGNMSAYLSWKASQDAKKPEQKSANDGQASRRDSQRQQAGGTARAAAPAKQSTVRPSQAETRTPATGTAGKGQKWEDFNKGRGTSKTNNPLITKDEWLMSKIKGRESPVEKKEEEDKKKKKKQSAANAAGWDGNKNY
jgi:hypothetical protein